MKPIWKHTVKSAAFILILVLLLHLLSGAFGPQSSHADYGMNHYHYSGIYGEPENSLDTVVIGNSLCYMAVSPIEMWERQGFTSFVCGNAMQLITTTYEHLYYTLQHQKPELVIMECENLYWDITWEDIFRMKLGLAFPVFGYHDMWRKMPKEVLLGQPYPELIDDSKGFYPNKEVAPYESEDHNYMGSPDMPLRPIPEPNRKCMEDIVKLCRDHDVELLLLSIPTPINWNWGQHKAVQEFADEWGLRYHDMNLESEEIGLDWSRHTFDYGDHMNLEAAEIYSRYLADWLAQEYDLPDHRQDPAFDQWHISAENYHVWAESDRDHKKPLLRPAEN